MATRKSKQKPERLALPGMDEVSPDGPPAYRVERGAVKRSHIDAVIAGRADIAKFTREQFDALMRVLVGLRVEAFDLPYDTFDGGTCAVVRRALKVHKPSELARAIRGAANDAWAVKHKPKLAAVFGRVPEFLMLADAAVVETRARTDVIADYVRLYPVAYDLDFFAPWPKIDDVEMHNAAVLEHYIEQMRATISRSPKLSAAQKGAALGRHRR